MTVVVYQSVGGQRQGAYCVDVYRCVTLVTMLAVLVVSGKEVVVVGAWIRYMTLAKPQPLRTSKKTYHCC